MSLRAAYWVWRRELHVMLRAPIVYVVGGVFLVVQGLVFAGLVGALSDPRKPAPLGALLEGQLAGTLLTWVLELVVLTLLGMRTIADDKRSGGWELLLTAQVGEGAAVIGKWLAAATIYALLWMPTLLYLFVVSMFRADDGGWDLATIASGYTGAIAVGVALLAWAIAASAAMASTLGAGALGFAFLIGLFLVGELPTLWPDLATDHPSIASALDVVSVRTTVGAFARGELELARVVVVLAVAVVGLSLAITLACVGRRRRGEVRTRTLGTALLGVIGVLAVLLAVRIAATWDVSAARRNSLDPETLTVLSELTGPATVTIVQPTLGGLEPLYDEVARILDRMAGPRVTVRRVDPANAPGGLPAIARTAGVPQKDLATGGAIVIDANNRRRVIELLALATFEAGPDGAPTVESLAVEQAVAGALAALSASTPPLTVCATTGHGELPLGAVDQAAADWSVVADRLRGEGMTIEDVAIAPSASATVPAQCSVLVVAGPAQALTAAEALAIQTFVRAGHGLLVAAPSRTVAGALASTGLEAVLAADGLGLPQAIVVDPALTIRELPGALLVFEDYADHPINTGFRGNRATLWFQPRPVLTSRGAKPMISATTESWGERDLVNKPRRDADDLAGPSILAALGSSGRVIALGSAESMSTALLSGGASAGDLWLARAIRFLAGQPERTVSIAARAPEQVRLVMTSAQRSAVIALSVAGIPLAWAVLGGLLVWWRRRRS